MVPGNRQPERGYSQPMTMSQGMSQGSYNLSQNSGFMGNLSQGSDYSTQMSQNDFPWGAAHAGARVSDLIAIARVRWRGKEMRKTAKPGVKSMGIASQLRLPAKCFIRFDRRSLPWLTYLSRSTLAGPARVAEEAAVYSLYFIHVAVLTCIIPSKFIGQPLLWFICDF